MIEGNRFHKCIFKAIITRRVFTLHTHGTLLLDLFSFVSSLVSFSLCLSCFLFYNFVSFISSSLHNCYCQLISTVFQYVTSNPGSTVLQKCSYLCDAVF
jgi:hypothetical protein